MSTATRLTVTSGISARAQCLALAVGACNGRCGVGSGARHLTAALVRDFALQWALGPVARAVVSVSCHGPSAVLHVLVGVSPTLGVAEGPRIIARDTVVRGFLSPEVALDLAWDTQGLSAVVLGGCGARTADLIPNEYKSSAANGKWLVVLTMSGWLKVWALLGSFPAGGPCSVRIGYDWVPTDSALLAFTDTKLGEVGEGDELCFAMKERRTRRCISQIINLADTFRTKRLTVIHTFDPPFECPSQLSLCGVLTHNRDVFVLLQSVNMYSASVVLGPQGILETAEPGSRLAAVDQSHWATIHRGECKVYNADVLVPVRRFYAPSDYCTCSSGLFFYWIGNTLECSDAITGLSFLTFSVDAVQKIHCVLGVHPLPEQLEPSVQYRGTDSHSSDSTDTGMHS